MTKRCPTCGETMEFTGLPDLAGPTRWHFYRCPECGIVKVSVDEEPEGWG